MLIKEALKILLLGDAGLASLVSDRIFPMRIPQKEDYPCIVWYRIRREVKPVLDTTKPDTWEITDWYEFNSMGRGDNADADAEDIDDALLELLHGTEAVVSDDASPESTLTIQGIFLETNKELYNDPVQVGASRSIYRVHFERKKRA